MAVVWWTRETNLDTVEAKVVRSPPESTLWVSRERDIYRVGRLPPHFLSLFGPSSLDFGKVGEGFGAKLFLIWTNFDPLKLRAK